MNVRISSVITSSAWLLASAALVLFVIIAPARAHDDPVAHGEETTTSTETTEATYHYETQAGNSYTALARKAIQTYGLENTVNLSGAEIVFAETKLTREAHSPVLSTGDEVNIEKATVQKWVEAAQKLDEATEARWNYYVQFVDFNTDNIGESH